MPTNVNASLPLDATSTMTSGEVGVFRAHLVVPVLWRVKNRGLSQKCAQQAEYDGVVIDT